MPSDAKTFYEQELDRLYAKDPLTAKHYALIRQSKAFMEKYYAERVELDTLAKAALMSRFHYVRMFKRVYGVTPRSCLREVRIMKAKEHLKAGQSITETCFNVGYESLATFSSTFKKCTGYSPKEYQHLYRTN